MFQIRLMNEKKKIFVFSFICFFIHSTDSPRACLLPTLCLVLGCAKGQEVVRDKEMGAAGGGHHICTGQSDVYSYMDRNIYKQNVVQSEKGAIKQFRVVGIFFFF